MPTGTQTTNTFEELLHKLYSQMTDLELADNPDWNTIAQLKGAVQAKIRQPIDNMAAQGQTQAPPQMAQSQVPGGGAMGAPPPGPMRAMGGAMNAGPQFSPDDLARIMAMQPGAQ